MYDLMKRLRKVTLMRLRQKYKSGIKLSATVLSELNHESVKAWARIVLPSVGWAEQIW